MYINMKLSMSMLISMNLYEIYLRICFYINVYLFVYVSLHLYLFICIYLSLSLYIYICMNL